MSDTKTIQRMKLTEADRNDPLPPVPIMEDEDYVKLATELTRNEANRFKIELATELANQAVKTSDELRAQVEKLSNDLLATRLAVRNVADRFESAGYRCLSGTLRDIADGKV